MVGDLIKFSAFGLLWLSQKETITRPIDWIWSIWLRRYWAPHKRAIGPHRNALFSAFKKLIICHWAFFIQHFCNWAFDWGDTFASHKMAIGPDRNASSTASPEIYSKNAKRCRVGALVGKEQQHNSDEKYRFRNKTFNAMQQRTSALICTTKPDILLSFSTTNTTKVERKECNFADELYWSYQAHDSLRKVVEV